jgi:pimeloyl-ACP methyl ester carboxylesterase
MDLIVETADGRKLAVEQAGDPAGQPVLVHMGTPNSRHLYEPNAADAAARGLRLICYDRPGYGGSTAQPGRNFADCAQDVRAICAALRIDRLGVWGISGGGPHALACAALLPDLVVAVASLASPAPYGAEGLDWFDGMGQDNVDDTQLTLSDPDAARAKTEADREEFLAAAAGDLAAAADALAKSMASLLTPTDAAVLTGTPMAGYLVRCTRDGLAPGSEGWWEDGLAHISPWGFDLADISVPVLLLHGREDKFVPFGHGQWLASHIPGVQARLLDHDGHLTLLEHRVPEVHSWLAGFLSPDRA